MKDLLDKTETEVGKSRLYITKLVDAQVNFRKSNKSNQNRNQIFIQVCPLKH